MFDFYIACNVIGKSEILNIHKYFMVKVNTKQCLNLLKIYLLLTQ